MKKLFLFCLMASIGLSQSLTLTWTDRSSIEDGYVVERSTDGTNFTELIGNLPTDTETYVDSNISYNVTYWYRVKAFNSYGNSDYSNIADGTATDGGGEIPPNNPDNLTVTQTS